MHPTQASRQHQQKRIQTHQSNADINGFYRLLSSDLLADEISELSPEHRERIYPPTKTLSMFLTQAMSADRSCQNVVNQAVLQRVISDQNRASTHTGAYCKARQKLPLAMVSQLTRFLGQWVSKQTPEHWNWNGRSVRLVDGTTVTLPDTEANQESFPQSSGQKPGLGFPICRIVGITCLSSGVVLNAAMGRCCGKGSNEQSLLRSIQDTFEVGDIVMGDAYFATYFFIAAMQARGVDIVMEQHGSRKLSTDFRKGQRIGTRDHLIQLNKPKKRPDWMSEEQYLTAPVALRIRELKTGGKILVTTLTDPKTYSKEDFKQFYKQRWHIELDIRNIKETLGMNILSCKSPELAIKEVWVYLLAYNLIRLMMAQSALHSDLMPRQISFKHCLQLWRCYLQICRAFDDKQLYELFMLMSEQRVGNRSGRIEPRAVKRRPKPFPLLTKPRHEARADVRKNGHPKKLK
ncbi:IS4 family transposase [Amphritea pacifica]|uniref:IS4 family transposase n=1 Tax=Amphritea pacifica TaxID=2811233 RepID=A0ABS2WE86_9GAMM|nr:IS4 family transposase [Amphritea pacifica]MBN0989908.1 IS4 family transposase [Amphritea pacifica]